MAAGIIPAVVAFPLAAVSVPSVFTEYPEMLPAFGNVQDRPGAIDEFMLATKRVLLDEASTAEPGTAPVATPLPLVLSTPVLKLILKGVTRLSPWVVTNRAPVPEVDEVDEQLPS